MINIVSESGGCCSDIFERRGEVAGVALMWLFPCTAPPAAAVSDQAQSALCRFCLPPQPFLGPARTVCSVLFHSRGDMEGEGIPPLGSLTCRGPQGSEQWMLPALCADRVGLSSPLGELFQLQWETAGFSHLMKTHQHSPFLTPPGLYHKVTWACLTQPLQWCPGVAAHQKKKSGICIVITYYSGE